MHHKWDGDDVRGRWRVLHGYRLGRYADGFGGEVGGGTGRFIAFTWVSRVWIIVSAIHLNKIPFSKTIILAK